MLSLEEHLRVSKAQYEACARLLPPKISWAEREAEIRKLYHGADGMNDIQKDEYFRSMADNNKSMLQAMLSAIDKVIAKHPENKNGARKKRGR